MADLASEPTELAKDIPTTDGNEGVDEDAPLATADASTADKPPAVETPSAPQKNRAVPGAVAIASGDPPSQDLLGELARAMHAAATSQYERMNAELERRRAEQVETIAGRAASDVERLKSSSQTDIAAIDSWAKAETERIELERIRRIDARREQLQAQLGRQDTIREREVFAVEAAIDAHRSEIDLFFGRMERELDPAAIAKVASTMPALPPLAKIADDARTRASAEFAELETEVDAPTGGLPATPDADPEATVTETRLMAVMDPAATQTENHADPSQDWAQPAAVSVAAGAATPAGPDEGGSKVGSTLLRTVRAIRPLSDHKEP
jgi:hypothetical protein